MNTLSRNFGVLVGLWGGCLGVALADKTPELQLDANRDYIVGASLQSSADPVGGDGRDLKLKPLWAFQWGRFRFATGGAAALLSLGREQVDAGLSTALLKDEHWSASGSLRWDSGRDADAPLLRGLPDVPSMLRGRVNLGYKFNRHWSANASASQDLQDRGGGLQWGTSFNYRHPVSSHTYWDASLGANWGNRTYMQTFYGISPAAAAASGRHAYESGAGLERVSLAWSMASALHERWVVYGGLTVSALQGDARRSPLVSGGSVVGASVGLAYRCCN